jgi:hypothetical protein
MKILVRIPTALICIVLASSVLSAGARVGRIDFLIPGMSLDSVSLVEGARVSYLVVSHSFGAADSSIVELRVLARSGGDFSVEILSSPYPKSIEESMRVKLRVSEAILRVSAPGEVRPCIREMLVRKGSEPYRKPTAQEQGEFDVESVFSRPRPGTERKRVGTERLATPAGSFLCDVVEYSAKEAKTVLLGGVKAERVEEETSRLWLSKEIPFWGLVRSSIEKKSSTIVAGGKLPAGADAKTTRTESTILSFRRLRARR